MKLELQIKLTKYGSYACLILMLVCITTPAFVSETLAPAILVCAFPIAGITVLLHHLHQGGKQKLRSQAMLQSANRREVLV